MLDKHGKQGSCHQSCYQRYGKMFHSKSITGSRCGVLRHPLCYRDPILLTPPSSSAMTYFLNRPLGYPYIFDKSQPQYFN